MGEALKNPGLAQLSKGVVDIVAENLETLIKAAPADKRATGKFAKYVGVGNGTVARLRKRDAKARISTLEKIGRRFNLEAWQMLVPGLDLSNRPRLFTPASEAVLRSRVEQLVDEFRGDAPPAPPMPLPSTTKHTQHKIRRRKS